MLEENPKGTPVSQRTLIPSSLVVCPSCFGLKVNCFAFYQYGCGDFLFCGYVYWLSEDKPVLLTVVQIHGNS